MAQQDRDTLTSAYELAFFIHPEPGTALDIATKALAKLEVASNAQFKRFYYTPSGRGKDDKDGKGFRTKVVLNDLHLLQRLVYIESEAVEKEQESKGVPLRQEDMVLRFVKHLVKSTLRRSSFYVNLGVSRLLHNYNTAETMELYSLVLQDPDRVRDDCYYRSRKKKLMKECRDRFGEQINVVRGFRGEQRFEELEEPGQMLDLVHESLKRFTPWNTECVLPPQTHQCEIPAFAFNGEDPDEEHMIEINRMHSLLHPACYERLTQSLNLPLPQDRVSIPRFVLKNEPKDDGGEPVNRFQPPELPEYERETTFAYLKAQRGHRGNASPLGELTLVIDGVRSAVFDPTTAKKINLELDESTELIEVYDENQHLLASCLVDNMEDHVVQTGAVRLEAGQRIDFKITARAGVDDMISGLDLEIGYAETQLVRAATLGFARMRHRVAGAAVPVWGAALAAVFVAALLLTNQGPDQAVKEPAPVLNEAPLVDADPYLTRSPTFTGLSLAQISLVYVDPIGESPFDEKLRSALIEGLKRTDHFQISPVRDHADAVIRNLQEVQGKDVHLSLVNVEGDIVWEVVSPKPADQNLDTLVNAIVENLVLKARQ